MLKSMFGYQAEALLNATPEDQRGKVNPRLVLKEIGASMRGYGPTRREVKRFDYFMEADHPVTGEVWRFSHFAHYDDEAGAWKRGDLLYDVAKREDDQRVERQRHVVRRGLMDLVTAISRYGGVVRPEYIFALTAIQKEVVKEYPPKTVGQALQESA